MQHGLIAWKAFLIYFSAVSLTIQVVNRGATDAHRDYLPGRGFAFYQDKAVYLGGVTLTAPHRDIITEAFNQHIQVAADE